MEREGHHPAANAAAFPCRRWAEDVIVLSSGRPPWQQPPSSAEGGAPDPPPPPLEKLYYKTKLCDKYEAGGRCQYEGGCSFAHGRAELRPPVPPPPHAAAAPHGFGGGGVWRRPGAEQEQQQQHQGGGGYGGKVCYNFRDRGSCHFGDNCAFPHASPAPPGSAIRGHGEQKPVGEPRRSATPPVRSSTAPRYAAPGPGRAFPPVPARDRLRQMPQEDGGGGGKASALTLLGFRKTNGIYGDWPEQYQY